MKRKLDTGHYTFSSGGEDDFSSLRSNMDNQGCNSVGHRAGHGCAIHPQLSQSWQSPMSSARHPRAGITNILNFQYTVRGRGNFPFFLFCMVSTNEPGAGVCTHRVFQCRMLTLPGLSRPWSPQDNRHSTLCSGEKSWATLKIKWEFSYGLLPACFNNQVRTWGLQSKVSSKKTHWMKFKRVKKS